MKIFTILFLITVVISLLLFDIVLRKQQRNHNAQWKRDGCPWGFFKFERAVGILAGCKARNVVFNQWLFKAPAWLAADPAALRYLYLFRISIVVGCVFWLCAVAMMIRAG